MDSYSDIFDINNRFNNDLCGFMTRIFFNTLAL